MQIGMRGRLAACLVALLPGLAGGCGDDKNKESLRADAGTLDAGPAQPILGGKLGEAVAAAASGGAPGPAPSAGGAQGPPESGVFAPGAGEAALPKGTPYKIELLGEGSEPRAKLVQQIDAKAEQKRSILLGLRTGGQGIPSVDVEIAFTVDKPKDKPPAGGEGAAQPQGVAVVAKVLSAVPASMSPGGPAKELTEAFGKLKGSVIRYQLSPANVISGLAVEPAKGVDPGLDTILQALGEAITALSAPLPDKPVGVGAYWMVADRAVGAIAKIPMLRYRVFKIAKIEQGAVSFSLDTRQYAEEPVAKLPTGQGELKVTIDALESSGKGALVWDPGALVPREAELGQRFQARAMPPDAQPGSQQRLVIQSELNVRLQLPAAPPP
jgi:hypothetical protein